MVISLDIDTLTNIWTFTQILEWRHTTQTDCRSEEWGDDVKSPCKVRTCHHLIKRLLEMEEKVSFYMMLHNPLWMQMQVGWLMMDCTDTGQRISVVMPSSMWVRESLLCCPLVCGTENLCSELSPSLWDRESLWCCPLVCGMERRKTEIKTNHSSDCPYTSLSSPLSPGLELLHPTNCSLRRSNLPARMWSTAETVKHKQQSEPLITISLSTSKIL